MQADDATSPSAGAGAVAPRSRREEFAAGDILVRFPVAEIARLLILSPIEKPGWHARLAGTAARPLFPGSAVLFENAFYEVRRISREGGPAAYRYELWAWEDRFPIREAFEYTREECVRVEAAVRAARRKQAAAHALAWTLPLVGLLPARLQVSIEDEYGLPAARATFWSALLLLGLSTFTTFAGFQALASLSIGGPRPGPASLLALRFLALSFYLAVESIVRYRLSFPACIPLGSAPVALPVSAMLWVRDALSGRARAAPTAPPEPQIRGPVPATAEDTVAELSDGRLEILSLLPKPHWGPRTAIHAREAWWMLEERQELAAPAAGAMRWRFVLAPWPEHLLVQDPQEYSPDEVRGLAFDAARERHRATVETLGPLFGLLPADAQQRLAEVYGHDPRSRTGWSLVLVAMPSAGAVVLVAGRMLQHSSDAADVVVGLAAAALLVEATVRGLALLGGEIRASVLGAVVRPLADYVLRLGPAA